MFLHNALSDGKAKAVAVVDGAGGIAAVETLKNMGKLLLAQFFSVGLHGK